MTRTLILKETGAGYAALPELTEPVTEPIVIERDGRPLGVLVPPDEYQKFAEFARRDQAERYIAEQRRLLDREIATYERMKSDLLKTHKGKFVAILNGELIDSDANKETLTERVYRKYGYRTMLIREVMEAPRIYQMGGPQLVRK